MRCSSISKTPWHRTRSRTRAPLIKAAREEDWSDKVLSFRMNGIDTKWWYDDLITVVGGQASSSTTSSFRR